MRWSAEESRERFARCRVARLATADAEGRPHLVPVTFAVDGDTVLTAVDSKPKRSAHLRRLANIRANPRVCLLADEYADDWDRLWWARADGHARIVEQGPEHDAALVHLRARYPQYRTNPPHGPVIIVAVHQWSGWSFR